MMSEKEIDVTEEMVISRIFVIRGLKVMLDRDLAALYGVETKRLLGAVRRNKERFPEDFMFELTEIEHVALRTQFASLKRGGHSKYLTKVFTEQGVAMLSSVLNSDKAIKVNIQIIRIFTKLKQAFTENTDIRVDLERIKSKLNNHDKNIELVFNYLDELMNKKERNNDERENREWIGYKKKLD